jgi:hypothetical protein
MPNRKTRRHRTHRSVKENDRIAGAKSVGDDRIFQNGMKKNERKYNKKRGVNRTKKNKRRYVNGGYSNTTTISAYPNPVTSDSNNNKYSKYNKKGLHKFLTEYYNETKMDFKELLSNIDEHLFLMKEGRKIGKIPTINYTLKVNNNPIYKDNR